MSYQVEGLRYTTKTLSVKRSQRSIHFSMGAAWHMSCLLLVIGRTLYRAVRQCLTERTVFFRYRAVRQWMRSLLRETGEPNLESATIDGSWFQSLMDVNIVHVQSGDAV